MTEKNSEKVDPSTTFAGADEGLFQGGVESLPGRLERYGAGRNDALELSAYLRKTDSVKYQPEIQFLEGCGNWLEFRHYYMEDEVRLHRASFCKRALLCRLCAMRRATCELTAYLPRWQAIVNSRPDLETSEVILTVRSTFQLPSLFEHLRKNKNKLLKAGRNMKQGQGGGSEWRKVEGCVGGFEVTYNPEKGWHPHIHMMVLHSSPLDEKKLSQEWEHITGDSFQVYVSPLKNRDDPTSDFLHVFKYSLKYSSLDYELRMKVYRVLRGRRLLFSSGLFRDVKVSKDLTDDELMSSPYFLLFYRYVPGLGYSWVMNKGQEAF